MEYIEVEGYFKVAVTKRTKPDQDILELILKEIKEDISVLKQDMTLVKNCPTIAKELNN